MRINNREVKFFFSVGAKYEIGTLDKSMDNFMRTVKSAVIMSKAYVNASKYAGLPADRPLEEGEVLALSDEEFTALCEEISGAFKEGSAISVEAEEDKKKEDEALSSTSAGVSTTE